MSEIADGDEAEVYDEEGDAYVAGVASLSGTRIDALVDHDGPELLRHRLVTYIKESVENPQS